MDNYDEPKRSGTALKVVLIIITVIAVIAAVAPVSYTHLTLPTILRV